MLFSFKSILLHFFVATIVVVVVVHCASQEQSPIDGSADIVDFSGDDLQRVAVTSEQKLLVEFYANWCGFCQRFGATWVEIGAALRGTDIRVARIDCGDDRNKQACMQHGVQSLPTIRLLQKVNDCAFFCAC
jgi:thioredoxin-like negative regulator of GroEL